MVDIRTHYKRTETFQYTHFSSCHPPRVKKGFIKGEALRLLRTNSSKTAFEEKIKHFQSHLIDRGYPGGLVQRTLSEVIFEKRRQALYNLNLKQTKNLAFLNAISPSSTKRKTNTHETLAFNSRTTIAQRNIQRTSPNIIQKGRSLKAQRHTRKI